MLQLAALATVLSLSAAGLIIPKIAQTFQSHAILPVVQQAPKLSYLEASLPFKITTSSSEAEQALAEHLQKIGAKIYGASSCPNSLAQMQLFGQEAANHISYIECDPKVENSQASVCKAANIKSLPTWKINGQFFQGSQSLDKLAKISGYQGTQKF